jgi:crotonobetainyl-CoA:carnitine CoA-transferase CaiB-like acyl-CoA transferase
MLDGILSWMVDGAKYNFAGESISGGKKRFQGRLAHYSIYRTKDGKYLAVGALEKKFWRNLCMKIGREDLTEKQPSDESPREDVKNELQKIFLTLSRDEWVERLKDEDVCIAPVQTLDEVFSDPHVLHRKMVVEQTHPKIGKIRQLGIPVKFSRTPGSIRSPAPELGENTEEILLELGYGKDEIVSLREKGVI